MNGESGGATEQKLAQLKKKARKVKIDEEHLYIVEGDLLLDEDQLEEYAFRQANLEKMEKLRREGGGVGLAPRPSPALVGVTEGGKIVRWAPSVELSYCVLKTTFSSDADYNEVATNMAAATQAWEDTCGVNFVYKADKDTSSTVRPDGVLFPVRGFDAGGRFIASAFFPNGPRDRRRVLIDPTYFTTSFDRVGVLRHELGHVLGFRHEHIRSGAPAVCPEESTSETFDFTPYDPQSCMHYFCGGVGTRDLAISEVDKAGSRRLYGMPLKDLRFIEE